MAAANESQGLKIAVAAFVALSVLLSISTYFAYQAYSSEESKRLGAEAAAKKATDAFDLATREAKFLRDEIMKTQRAPK